ncbi:1-phosphatidylinositol 4,5-bisphosphate phosphodiesterase delta-4 [Clydaea vesicula]|uniref:Phosphoinositide phospholipase C n=1 Tax=Clydaea vesicula TaxID=447962 RepID=A0AAD5U1X0_9FUNG|nr:1-phosphatidylinositol 4,5-bisphosphate phosphodiesterase delta-4 [Clydaea vesicula]
MDSTVFNSLDLKDSESCCIPKEFDLMHYLIKGTKLLKIPNKKSSFFSEKPTERLVKIDELPLQISWQSKKNEFSSVDFNSVREIRRGQNTKAFEYYGKRPELEDRSFSVIYFDGIKYGMLNFIAPTKFDADCWVFGLYRLLNFELQETDISADSFFFNDSKAINSDSLQSFLKNVWNKVDTKNENKLNLVQVVELFKKINITLSVSEIKSAFKNSNLTKNNFIDFYAFERLYKNLRLRRDIAEIFLDLSKTKKSFITYEEFKYFSIEIQKNDWSEEQLQDYYRKYTPADTLQENNELMDIDHFSAFLISANNSIYKKEHLAVFQNMSHPLKCYYINTSHNTFLLGDQLKVESSLEGYIRVLQRGCRCIEVKCWDGPHNQPQVYHTRTFTSKLFLKDVIEVIKKYAFVVSKYPLIISLENHCGIDQQSVIIKLLHDILGSSLLIAPLSSQETKLPSPEALMNKILVLGKELIFKENGAFFSKFESEDDTLTKRPIYNSSMPHQTALNSSSKSILDAVRVSPPASPSQKELTAAKNECNSTDSEKKNLSSSAVEENDKVLLNANLDLRKEEKIEDGEDDSCQHEDVADLKKTDSDSSCGSKINLLQAFINLVIYFKPREFIDFEHSIINFNYNNICFIGEKKSLQLALKQREAYLQHNRRFLTTVYSSPLRVTSKNFDPFPHWKCGVQTIALNHQTFDRGMQLNHALFTLNGRSGYVLKPKYLRSGNCNSFLKTSVSFTIKIISAQQLPKYKGNLSSAVINPFCMLEVVGEDSDCNRFKTKGISSNGLNPIWKESFTFKVKDSSLCFLRFQIFDVDNTNDFIACYCAPLFSLQQGYRHAPLFDWKVESENVKKLIEREVDTICKDLAKLATKEELEQFLLKGQKMSKLSSKVGTKPKEKFVKIELLPLRIVWESKKKHHVDFSSIREIRKGQNTLAFELFGKSQDLDLRSFSIIYFDDIKSGTLNFICPTVADCVKWTAGLEMLLEQHKVLNKPSSPQNFSAVHSSEKISKISPQNSTVSNSSTELFSGNLNNMAKTDAENPVTKAMSPTSNNLLPTVSNLPSFAASFEKEKLYHILDTGIVLLKIPNKPNSKAQERLFKVDCNKLQISWESKKKKKLSFVLFSDVREIRLGQNTKAFEIYGKNPDLEECSFSIIYFNGIKYGTLNFIAPSKRECKFWVAGLHLILAQDSDLISKGNTGWLRKYWNAVDVNNDNVLGLDQVTEVCGNLNIKLSKAEIKSAFKNQRLSKNNLIEFEAFERMYQSLRLRKDIAGLFTSLCNETRSGLTYSEFKNFIINVQKNHWTEEQFKNYYDKYRPQNQVGSGNEESLMDIDHFSAFLISANNSIFKKEHSSIYQDMTQPLSSYFINTSHNTYLLGDQFTGESSVEAYIRALQFGCKCVELDCWDGPNGQPIIFHGRTLTSRIPFKDVVEYGFVVSPYPVILSLEIHCDHSQQEGFNSFIVFLLRNLVMAQIFQDVLGDKLLTHPIKEEETVLPSPLELLNKFIIKAKIVSYGDEIEEDELYPELDTTAPAAKLTKRKSFIGMLSQVALSISPTSSVTNSASYSTLPNMQYLNVNVESSFESSQLSVENLATEEKNINKPLKQPKKSFLSPKLMKLVIYFKTRKFLGFEKCAETFEYSHMCSIGEKNSTLLATKNRTEYKKHNSKFVTRTYPSNLRVNSSNYDPIPHWKSGVQMVSLNFQTFDRSMQLNQALFTQNGRCGYILKGAEKQVKVEGKPALTVSVQIISAQQLPKKKAVEPYVLMEVVCDDIKEIIFKTKAIRGNVSNPIWNEVFRFSVEEPELAFLRFQILGAENLVSNEFIASYTIPILSLEQGYRHAPLFNYFGEFQKFSSLFLKISIDSNLSEDFVTP